MNVELEAKLQRLVDRQEIIDCMLRYTRGIDRLDRELLMSAYHPDAIDDHGVVVMSEDWCDWVFDFHAKHHNSHTHFISNQTLDIDGDVAHGETYFMFCCTEKGKNINMMNTGRYIDRFERRCGRWAIARAYVSPRAPLSSRIPSGPASSGRCCAALA